MIRLTPILCIRAAALLVPGLAEGQEAAPDLPKDTAEVSPGRSVSPRVAALLAAAAPKFEPPKPASTAPSPLPALPPADRSANEIVRLPNYIVRESKLPTRDQVDQAGFTRRLMERYLGPEDGFDRGFLNLLTSKQIPLLGLFGSISNEQRARMMYAQDERQRKMNDLLELAALARKPGTSPNDDELTREIKKAFSREPTFQK